MGLLDFLNTEGGQQGLGLLAAAGPRADGAGFGQRLQEGLGAADAWKMRQAKIAQEAQQAKMQEMQMQQLQKQMEDKAKMQGLVQQYAKPAVGLSADGYGPTQPASFDRQGYASALESIDPIAGLQYAASIQKQGPEFSTAPQYDQNGRAFVLAKDGSMKYLDGVKARDKLNEVRLGDKVVFRTDYSPELQGTALPIGQSADSKATTAVSWANNAIAKERLGMDKAKDAAESANGGYSTKPLPAAALKMQNDAIDVIGASGNINKMMSSIEKQIDDKKVKFGPVSNLLNQGLNSAGMSTEESRNFSSFKSNLEKIRNESLRLNTGVQTDGDAQRAWNELFQNITDTELVKQRLGEIKALNNRATELQKLKLDGIRGNYKVAPYDYRQLPTTDDPDSSTPATPSAPKVATLADIAATANASGKTTEEVTRIMKQKGYTVIGGQ